MNKDVEIAENTTDCNEQLKLYYTKDPSIWGSLLANNNLISEIQHLFIQQNNSDFDKFLLINPNLQPELFSNLIMKYQKSYDEYTSLFGQIKYNNPQTQELLEKYLLLK